MSEREPIQIGVYRLDKKLGAGGMGIVWQATDTSLDRPVAIKMMRAPEYLGKGVDLDEIHARFLREARAAARIKSRYVAQVLQLGETPDGEVYIVMELLHGHSLTTTLQQHGGQLPAPRVVAIGKQVCRGLQAAHDLGIIHRDLKPDNVMLVSDDDGEEIAKILDFGVAKLTNEEQTHGLTQAGALLGTLPYMAPEQLSAGHIDNRTDVYACGMMLYRMLTGATAFSSESLSDIVRHQLMTAPRSMFERVAQPTFNRELDAVVLRCLEKDPAHRWQSMKELAEALDAAGRGIVPAGLLPVERTSVERDPRSSSLDAGPPMESSSSSVRRRVAPGDAHDSQPGTSPRASWDVGTARTTPDVPRPHNAARSSTALVEADTMHASARAANDRLPSSPPASHVNEPSTVTPDAATISGARFRPSLERGPAAAAPAGLLSSMPTMSSMSPMSTTSGAIVSQRPGVGVASSAPALSPAAAAGDDLRMPVAPRDAAAMPRAARVALASVVVVIALASVVGATALWRSGARPTTTTTTTTTKTPIMAVPPPDAVVPPVPPSTPVVAAPPPDVVTPPAPASAPPPSTTKVPPARLPVVAAPPSTTKPAVSPKPAAPPPPSSPPPTSKPDKSGFKRVLTR